MRDSVACRVCVPMVRATWGSPPIVTVLSNSTRTSIVSPSSYVPPLAGKELKAISLTPGGVLFLPFTLLPRSTVTGPCVRSTSIAPTVVLMVPPLRASALAAMLTPSSSRSSSCTV